MKFGFIKCAFLLGIASWVSVAAAHPYASGVSNSGGLISWVLNEPASDVEVIFDNGAMTNDYGPGLAVGTNTFALGSHTNFSILVYKVESNGLY